MKTAIIFLAACSVVGGANAQVNRCTDAAGKVTFSDLPCQNNQKAVQVGRAISLEEIERERVQAAQARDRFLTEQYEEQRPERERQAAIAASQQKQLADKEERRQRRTVCHSSGYATANNGFGSTYSGTTICR